MAIAPEQRAYEVRSPFLQQFVCVQCGYGASRQIAPERCPMCSGSVWELSPSRVTTTP
jgi:rubrerythrin